MRELSSLLSELDSRLALVALRLGGSRYAGTPGTGDDTADGFAANAGASRGGVPTPANTAAAAVSAAADDDDGVPVSPDEGGRAPGCVDAVPAASAGTTRFLAVLICAHISHTRTFALVRERAYARAVATDGA
jgi:hypothetical protein